MKNFDEEIKAAAEKEGKAPIFDGIVDEKMYNAASKKILWILKEANSTDEDGSWDMREHIALKLKPENENYDVWNKWQKTFTKIVYVTNGLLNNIGWRDELRHPNGDPDVIDELKKMAYINVKKTGGVSSTPVAVLKKHYTQNQALLRKQIDAFKPDILIFGGTFHLFKDDLKLPEVNKYASCNAISKDGQIYIDAYHPQYFAISDEKYFNDIVNAVKSESK